MNHATPKMRYFAARLIVHEAEEKSSLHERKPTAVPVIEKLRPLLVNLTGSAGFRALLSRALALSTHEVPWMDGWRVAADGTLDGLEEVAEDLGPEELAVGSEVLLARLLGLLVAFIGEILTIRIVREVWPQLPPLDDFEQGDENEKSN